MSKNGGKLVGLNFNVSDADLTAPARKILSDDIQLIAWRTADNIFPMHSMQYILLNYEFFILGLLLFLIFIWFCWRKMSEYVVIVQIFVCSILIQTLYTIFTVAYFSDLFER